MQRSFNHKVYASMEEVLRDYESREDISALIFNRHPFSTVVFVREDGSIDFVGNSEPLEYRLNITATHYVERNLLVKTKLLLSLIEDWINAGSTYESQLKKIYRFLKEGGYSWIAHRINGFSSHNLDYKEEEVNRLNKNGLDSVRSFFEKAGTDELTVALNRIANYMWNWSAKSEIERADRGLDYQLLGEEDVVNRAIESIEGTGSWEFNGFMSRIPVEGDKILAIFGNFPSVVGPYSSVFDIIPSENRSYLKEKIVRSLEEEKEEYLKMGVLPFFPEVFVLNLEQELDEEIDTNLLLSLFMFQTSHIEVGMAVAGWSYDVGTNLQAKNYSLLFLLPFLAINPRIGINIKTISKPIDTKVYVFERRLSIEVKKSDIQSPTIFVYKSSLAQEHKPKFQLLSLSRGPSVILQFRYIEKVQSIYAPLAEYVSSPKSDDSTPTSYRVFVGRTVDLPRKKLEYYVSTVKRVSEIISSLESLPSNHIWINAFEVNKVEDMLRFSRELIEEVIEEKNKKGEPRDSEVITRKAEEYYENQDLAQYLKSRGVLCFLSSDKEKVKIETLNNLSRTHIFMDISRMSSILSTSFLDDYGLGPFDEMLEESIKKAILSGETKKGVRGFLDALADYMKSFEEIEDRSTFNMGWKEGMEVRKKAARYLKKLKKEPEYSLAAKTIEFLSRAQRELGEDRSPSITVVVHHHPEIKLEFEVTDDEWRKDLMAVFYREGEVPKQVVVSPKGEDLIVFMDFKETGLRIASIILDLQSSDDDNDY